MATDDTPALRPDGTLRDASEMSWDDSPSQSAVPLPSLDSTPSLATQNPASSAGGLKIHFYQPPSTTPTAPTQRKGNSGAATSKTSGPNGKVAATPTVTPGGSATKNTAVERRLKRPAADAVDTSDASSEVIVLDDLAVSEQLEEHERKRRKKGKALEDVLTVFRPVSEVDSGKGFECQVCVANKKAKPFQKIQTVYKGNSSALRTHIARQGEDHYSVYKTACKKLGIRMDDRARPKKDDADASGDEQQPSITQFMSPREVAKDWTKDGLFDMVTHFVVETDQALSIVDHPAFRELLLYQRPSMKDSDLCHRTKLTEGVQERARLLHEALEEELKECPGKVSLTFDGWTSKIMTAYLAITAHYITADWIMRTELLSFIELEGSHSGENIGQELYEVIKKYGLEDKVGNLTADNVSVNDKSIRILGQKLKEEDATNTFHAIEQRSHCFAHAIHLAEAAFLNALSPKKKGKSGQDVPIVEAPSEGPGAPSSGEDEETEEQVQELMDEVAEAVRQLPSGSDEAILLAGLLLKVRGFVTKVRRSPQAKKFFKKCCTQEVGRMLELLPYCKTRWGTWYDVITRLLTLKKAVTSFINLADDSDEVPNVDKGQRKYSEYRFDAKEWNLMSLIHQVLKEASTVQAQLSSETVPTVCQILPLYEEFMDRWATFRSSPEMAPLAAALDCGIASLEKYYNKSEKQPANIVSMYLNPAIKNEYFACKWTFDGQREAQRTIEKVYDRYLNAAKHRTSVTASLDEDTTASDQVGKTSSYAGSWLAAATARRRQREADAMKDGRAELTIYLGEPLEDISSQAPLNVLAWWKKHEGRFPVLAQIARDFLPIQGSSVPCERSFSSAGLTDDKRRGALTPENFGALQLLKSKYRAERKSKEEMKAAQREAQRKRWEQDE